jgi:tRNA 5-methylaminomethyl-2-thiouridine biosynthesis bifunctional protein
MKASDAQRHWRGQHRWVLLTTHGFGSGEGFIDLWHAWKADPQRCAELHVIAIEPTLPTRAAITAARPRADAPAHRATLHDALRAAWPTLTPNLHHLRFESGRVTLALAAGDPGRWLRELVAAVDAFELGATTPWGRELFKALARLATSGAILDAATEEAPHRKAMREAGFVVQEADPSLDDGRTQAVFAPTFVPRLRGRVRRSTAGAADRSALIVGAGIAGCAAAWALSERGWRSTVVDRHAGPAAEASGNPAGLFHGIVTPHDGAHARLYRAAAIDAHDAVAVAIAQHGVAGGTLGMLRQETRLDQPAMAALLERLGLPPDYVRALGPAEAGAIAGLPQRAPAWFYPGGGWVDPAGLARSFLERAGKTAEFRGGVVVDRLRRDGAGWELLDAHGAVIDRAFTVVLANAADALRLAGLAGAPVRTVRGQVSWFEADVLPARLQLPRVPLAGSGYLLPAVDGRAMFGATAQPGDLDAAVRSSDHARNLAQLATLLGHAVEADPSRLQGRTGWRCVARDRLPLIGAAPLRGQSDALRDPLHDPPEEPGGSRGPNNMRSGSDAARRLEREPGLFVYTALGSRGITWSALGARIVAAAVSGAPAPVEASLLDAVDPARFASRALRRSGKGAASQA